MCKLKAKTTDKTMEACFHHWGKKYLGFIFIIY